MDPNEEQYRTAVREAERIVDRFRRLPGCVTYRPDREAAPPALLHWIRAHAEEMTGRTMRKCQHGGWSQVHYVMGMEPNRARCLACQDRHARELDAALQADHHTMLDCDLCGTPENVLTLAHVVFPVAALVVRMLACNRCLNERHNGVSQSA